MNHTISFQKCMGGLTVDDNLVNLTPEEHFVAHQLLVKMYPNNRGLIFAANMMGGTRETNKSYGWIKRKLSNIMKDKNPAKELDVREKMSIAKEANWANTEYRRMMVESHLGQIPGNSKYHIAPKGKSWCNKHKKYLSIQEFAKDSKRKSGLFVMCKTCYKKHRKR